MTLLFLQESELLWEPSLPNPPPRALHPFPRSLVFLPNTSLQFGKSPLYGQLKCPFGTWEVTVECLAPPRAPLGQGHPQPQLSESQLIPIVDPSLPPHGENPHSLRPSLPLSTHKLLVSGTEPPRHFHLDHLVRGDDDPVTVSGLLATFSITLGASATCEWSHSHHGIWPLHSHRFTTGVLTQ